MRNVVGEREHVSVRFHVILFTFSHNLHCRYTYKQRYHDKPTVIPTAYSSHLFLLFPFLLYLFSFANTAQ
jgi:MoaA/NifB/PqqE/SkfB family radical SAM enzyme